MGLITDVVFTGIFVAGSLQDFMNRRSTNKILHVHCHIVLFPSLELSSDFLCTFRLCVAAFLLFDP